jgi:hypothetical protein
VSSEFGIKTAITVPEGERCGQRCQNHGPPVWTVPPVTLPGIDVNTVVGAELELEELELEELGVVEDDDEEIDGVVVVG